MSKRRADLHPKANSKTRSKTSAVAMVPPVTLFGSPVLLAGEDDAGLSRTSQPRPRSHKPGRYHR